jgi:alkylation response protein AidB-like acyl-CoA dehydrogenase
MVKQSDVKNEVLEQIINEQLKPIIRNIDQEGFYPKEFLKAVGGSGLLDSNKLKNEDIRFRELQLIEGTSKYCMTTAFTLWCHLGALTSVRMSNNLFLKNELLPLLETGEVLGGTGLSNALKYYAGLDTIRLKAERVEGGYTISGMLPSVSNLGEGHWFVILASLNQNQRVVCMIPVNSKGLKLKRRSSFVGLNGSATYSCNFYEVFVPNRWVVTEEADKFISKIRPILALYQIPLGIGVADASLQSILDSSSKNIEANQHVKPKPEELKQQLQLIREKTYEQVQFSDLTKNEKEILLTRLDIVHLTSKAVYADMLYAGGYAYMKDSEPFRRLRESYFLINLTPTVKQLEKLREKV